MGKLARRNHDLVREESRPVDFLIRNRIYQSMVSRTTHLVGIPGKLTPWKLEDRERNFGTEHTLCLFVRSQAHELYGILYVRLAVSAAEPATATFWWILMGDLAAGMRWVQRKF